MATALKVTQIERTRQQAVYEWYEWKKAGRGPATRDAALRIVGKHVGLDLSTVQDSLARTRRTFDGTEKDIDDRLSLMVWDIQENGGALIDYSNSIDRILYDLLYQAGQMIRFLKNRLPVKRVIDAASKQLLALAKVEAPDEPEKPISAQQFYKVPGEGYKHVRDATPSKLDKLAEKFIKYAIRALLRWKALGADADYIRRFFARMQDQVLEKFE